MQSRYGITLYRYYQLLKEQNGTCAVCQKPTKQSLAVDHDHTTGAVRGLLCAHCNTAIGLLRDCKSTMVSALMYLLKDD